jgi:hypothetical protein
MGKKISIISLILVTLVFLLIAVNRQSKVRTMNNTINTALSSQQKQEVSSVDSFTEIIYGNFKKNVIALRLNKKCGLYDTITKTNITPIQYDNIGSFSEEGAIDFTQNKKYGFLNNKGVEIVKAEYDFVLAFSDGLAAVKLNDKWGLVDKTGKLIAPIEYDKIWGFSTGLAAVCKNWKWGFINKQGNYVIKPIYDDVITKFNEKTKLANVAVKEHHFFIDVNGEFIKDAKGN